MSQLQIRVLKEYEEMVPAVSDNDFEKLKDSIQESGLWYPIIVNSEGIILDGHHRYRVCRQLKTDVKYVVKDFPNKLLEKLFVIDANLKRRHLNPFQRTEVSLKAKPILEELSKENSLRNLKQGQTMGPPTGKYFPVGRVDEEIGKRAEVSYKQVQKVETIIAHAKDEDKEKLRKGQTTISRVFKELKKEDEIAKRKKLEEEAQKKRLEEIKEWPKLYFGEFQTEGRNIADNSIDLIFTDPPYGYDDLYLYNELGKFANRVLKDGGSLVTYVGSITFLEILDHLRNSGLNFWWQLIVAHTGGTSFMHPRSIAIRYKPLFWFVKGRRLQRKIDYMPDLVMSKPPDKTMHRWAQSPVEATQVIRYLTLKGDIICDPMMGSGTTGIAAERLERRFIGIENDPKHFKNTKSMFDSPKLHEIWSNGIS